ncbi:hypothetical protein HPB47_000973 [Ixodes persulcatus]|uniref:Uncharacterized protein n=1 Tax=Ixodes persulcatus TaxID=34615 RepID=A0AC60PQC2_IXOPE|nr:hypothetical protein HPB47_000973 [Ixodes persulcatus]
MKPGPQPLSRGGQFLVLLQPSTGHHEEPPPHKNPLPGFIRTVLEPVFERLGDRALLKRCSDGMTQNAIECLHSVIWGQNSKNTHDSLLSVERAVAEAVSRFNQGMAKTSKAVAAQLRYSTGSCLIRRSLEKANKLTLRVKRSRRAEAERLAFHASSTTTELAALQLGLRLLDENEPAQVVVLADSRAALSLLHSPDRSPQLATEVVERWLPSHCGTSGNERADQLAARAHGDPGCPLSPVPPFADARLLVRRRVALSHPELEHGPLPRRLPRRLTRGAAAALYRLRTGSSFTPAGRARWRTDRDSSWEHCGAHGDAEHLMCHCPRFSDARADLGRAYSALGCPSDTLDELLRPRLPRAGTERWPATWVTPASRTRCNARGCPHELHELRTLRQRRQRRSMA